MVDNEREIVIYTIDKDNRIISVGEGWEHASIIGGAQDYLEKNKIIGHFINEYISDEATQIYYDAIFKSCRLNQEVITNEYRCDSPSHQRFMKTTFTPHENGNITLFNETLYQVPFQQKLFIEDKTKEITDSSSNIMKRCSICNCLQSHDNLKWIEPKMIAGKENLHIDVVHTVCSDCKSKISKKLYAKKSKSKTKQKLSKQLFYYAKYFSVVTALVLGAFYIIIINENNWQREKYKEESMLILRNINANLQNEFSTAASDLLQLSNTSELFSVTDQDSPSIVKKYVLNTLVEFMYHKPIYDQLRLLDLYGMEKFRINNSGGKPFIVTQNELQSKGDRYYVQEALKIAPHEIYISSIDLNMEKGKIEIPYKPVFRIATIIYDEAKQAQGLLILNVNFQKLIDIILSINMSTMPTPYLANGLGNWLIAPNDEQPWSFMFADPSNQVKIFSNLLWESMQKTPSGTLNDSNSLISYKELNPLKMLQPLVMDYDKSISETLLKGINNTRLHLWLIHAIPDSYIREKAWGNILKALPYFLIGIVILFVFTAYLIRLYRRLSETNNELQIVETGFENSDDGMLITDEKMTIIKVNAKYEVITGYSAKELLGNTPKIISSGWTSESVYIEMKEALIRESYWEGEIIDRQKDDSIHHQWLRIIALKDNNDITTHYLGIARDITERKKSQDRIQKLAFEDVLTGLPNRQLLLDRIEHAIAASKRHNHSLALIFIDLDDFKIINDSAGHMTGDKVLIAVAQRLQAVLRDTDTISRIGGDEFVILLEEVEQTLVSNTIERILETFAQSMTIGAEKYFLSASIGAALYPQDAQNTEELFRNADTAMYTAKNMGKNRYSFFVTQMNEAVTRQMLIIQQLQIAVKEGSFTLVYQPQISLSQNKVVGAEALIRWTDPKLGFVSPAEFIPISESSGLIVPITMWVLEQTCLAVKRIQNQHKIRVAVNISSKHIKEKYFAQNVHNFISSFDVNPKQIELEITEGALIENVDDTVKKLEELKSYGYRIAIDDFGTGYSSLSYLKKFGFEKLKIDQEFIRSLPEDEEDVGITKSIIAIGKALGMKLIAEGAETEENVNFLREHGCDMIQGYYFSKPLSLDDFITFTSEFNKNS